MQDVEGVSSVSMSQNHTCYRSVFCRESLQLESSFVFRQNTVALTSAGEGNQTHAQTLGPKRAGAAGRLKNTLMSSFWLWVPETVTISFSSFRASSWSGRPLSWSTAQLPRALLGIFKCPSFLSLSLSSTYTLPGTTSRLWALLSPLRSLEGR